MKKPIIIILLATICTFCLYSCGKDAIEQPLSTTNDSSKLTEEKVYKSTGCRVINAQSIAVLYDVFIDSSGFRYLYGSRKTTSGKMFWFSKYTSQGNLIWETNKAPNDESYTRAFLPKEISSGDIVIACIIDVDIIDSKTMIPTIISKSDGVPTFVKVIDNYFYSYINVYDNFFICGINDKELHLNPNATKWFSQISNDGNIIQSRLEMAMPYGSTIWKNKTNFISADSVTITRGNTAESSNTWTLNTGLPTHNSYNLNLSFSGDTVIAKYALDANKETIYTYRISYDTGKIIKDSISGGGEYKYLDLGKEYLAPNNMTVIMNTVKISDNNQGTTYYAINYTLKNETKLDIIQEGSFDAYYSLFSKGETQYGFFDDLYPGESKTREYTFKTLSDNPFLFIQYKHKWDGSDSEILRNSLKWKVISE